MVKITDEVFQVGGGAMTSYEDAAIYLIRFGGDAALVDAGCGKEVNRLFDNIGECGVEPSKIRYLLITHCHFDHTGGIEAIRDKTGCKVVAHALEAPYMENGDSVVTAANWYGTFFPPTTIDIKLEGDRSDIELGGRKITAVHTPGHSPGSVVYLTESDGLKVLFAQDVHGPLHENLLSNAKQYNRSLELLLTLDADILCEGHFGVFRGKEEVVDYIESFL